MDKQMEIAEENAETNKSIQEQYDEKMEQIRDLQDQIDKSKSDLAVAIDKGLTSMAKRINLKLGIDQKKLKIYTDAAQDWLADQKKTVAESTDDVLNSLKKRIADEAKRLVVEMGKSTQKRKENKKKKNA